MSELVKELRHLADLGDSACSDDQPDCSDALRKAADEIERLQAEVERLQDAIVEEGDR